MLAIDLDRANDSELRFADSRRQFALGSCSARSSHLALSSPGLDPRRSASGQRAVFSDRFEAVQVG